MSSPADSEIARLRQAMTREPGNPAPLFELCVLLLRRGDPAANQLLPQLDTFRTYGPGWLQVGEALFKGGHLDAAIVAYARVDGGVGLFGQGRCLRGLGRTKDAAAKFEAAVERQPDLAPAWYALGLVRDDLQEPSAAVAYETALALDPTFHEAALNLGIARQEAGELEAALDAYGQAFRIRPDALGRIAHALSSSRAGCLFLDLAALGNFLRDRAVLAFRPEALAIDPRA